MKMVPVAWTRGAAQPGERRAVVAPPPGSTRSRRPTCSTLPVTSSGRQRGLAAAQPCGLRARPRSLRRCAVGPRRPSDEWPRGAHPPARRGRSGRRVPRRVHLRLRRAPARLHAAGAGQPGLLLVSDLTAAEAGGSIGLVTEDGQVRFDINQASQRDGLRASAQLLRLAERRARAP